MNMNISNIILLFLVAAGDGRGAVWRWLWDRGGGHHAPNEAAASVRASGLFVPRAERPQLRKVAIPTLTILTVTLTVNLFRRDWTY